MNLSAALNPLFNKRSVAVTVDSGFNLFGGVTTKQGTPVNAKSALTLSAFYNGIEIITSDFAKLPKGVFKQSHEGRFKQRNHPVNYLVAKQPNQYMTPYMFFKMLVQYAILKGNGYAEIERNQSGTPVSFQLIDQEQHPVEVIQYNNKLFYKFNNKVIAAADMLHIPGFSYNGITGVSVITHAANQLGVSLSSQEYATDYYNEKGIGYGVVTSATKMDNDAKYRLGEALSSVFSNSQNYKVPIIDEAAKFQHIKITPQESQFLATNKQGVEEVARWLNIPPHKLKTLDNVNNSITENLEIQHLQDSMLPWIIKVEQECNIKLFSQAEVKAQMYLKVNVNALLRMDSKTKTDYLTKGIMMGWITRNEARAFEEMNPLEGLDEPLTPVNTQTQEQVANSLNDE